MRGGDWEGEKTLGCFKVLLLDQGGGYMEACYVIILLCFVHFLHVSFFIFIFFIYMFTYFSFF